MFEVFSNQGKFDTWENSGISRGVYRVCANTFFFCDIASQHASLELLIPINKSHVFTDYLSEIAKFGLMGMTFSLQSLDNRVSFGFLLLTRGSRWSLPFWFSHFKNTHWAVPAALVKLELSWKKQEERHSEPFLPIPSANLQALHFKKWEIKLTEHPYPCTSPPLTVSNFRIHMQPLCTNEPQSN